MKSLLARGTCTAAVLAMGTVVFAQSTAQQPPTPQSAAPQVKAQATDQVTITGCVQREADYRAANNLGGGGVAGTGVGAGNEFVLTNATIAPAAGAVGTSGTPEPSAGAPAAFELTGENEGKASEFVGKRVEVIGKLKAAEMGPAGATGGATAGKPPTGVDVASKDMKLREIEVTSIKETTGTCPAK